MLVGDNVALRPVARGDLNMFGRWDEDAEVTRYLGRTFDRYGGVDEWFTRTCTDPCCRVRAVTTASGTLIGYLTLEGISWRAGSGELKICLGDKRFWNRGYGTEAVRGFLALMNRWGVREVVVRVYREHTAAIRCYQKAGFTKEAALRGGRIPSDQELYLMKWRGRAS